MNVKRLAIAVFTVFLTCFSETAAKRAAGSPAGETRLKEDARAQTALYTADIGEGVVYRVNGGERVRLTAELMTARAGGEPRYHYAVVIDEDGQSGDMLRSGVVFFGTDGRQRRFVPVPETVGDIAVTPSPRGTRFVISYPDGDNARVNRVYSVERKRPLTTVRGAYHDWRGPIWVDEYRFVYTAYDDTKMKKPGVHKNFAGYASVVLFDTISLGSQTLKAAAPLDEYIVSDYRDGFVLMSHHFVDALGQWSDSFEGGESLHVEENYVWLTDRRPGTLWRNPDRTYVVDADGNRVIMLDRDGRSELKTTIHRGTYRDSVKPDGEDSTCVPYCWFTTGEKEDARLSGETSAVYIFAGQENMSLCAVIPTVYPERVRDVSISPAGERLLVARGEEKSRLRSLDLYRLTLREHEGTFGHQFTLTPTYGPFFWIDPWRVAYTRLNLEADLDSGREPGYALDVCVYDSSSGEDWQMTESAATDSYQVMGLEGDDILLIDYITVPARDDWKDPARERRRRLKGRLSSGR